MQIYLIEKNTSSVILGIKNANTSLITPLIDLLNRDPNVDLVRFIETHPELDDSRLMVVVKSGSAKDALIRASVEMSSYFSKIENKGPYRVPGVDSGPYRVPGVDSGPYRVGGA